MYLKTQKGSGKYIGEKATDKGIELKHSSKWNG